MPYGRQRQFSDEERRARHRQVALKYYYRNREACLTKQKAFQKAHPQSKEQRATYRAVFYSRHREKVLAENKAWRLSNRATQPERSRRSWLRQYGLTPEDYDRLLKRQRGRCAICRSAEPKTVGGRHFAVDHDHSTGRVRGLLCRPCNTALGLFRDDRAVLRHAIRYLRGH